MVNISERSVLVYSTDWSDLDAEEEEHERWLLREELREDEDWDDAERQDAMDAEEQNLGVSREPRDRWFTE
jgi:hypothetical protein